MAKITDPEVQMEIQVGCLNALAALAAANVGKIVAITRQSVMTLIDEQSMNVIGATDRSQQIYYTFDWLMTGLSARNVMAMRTSMDLLHIMVITTNVEVVEVTIDQGMVDGDDSVTNVQKVLKLADGYKKPSKTFDDNSKPYKFKAVPGAKKASEPAPEAK